MHLVIAFVVALVILGQVGTGRRSFGPGVCGPIDPVYARTAAETGGQPFSLGPAEIAKMALVLSESSRSDSTMILWAGGTTADADGGFIVPVDTIRAGQDTWLSFIVKNHGPRARYRVTATVGATILKRVEPPIVE